MVCKWNQGPDIMSTPQLPCANRRTRSRALLVSTLDSSPTMASPWRIDPESEVRRTSLMHWLLSVIMAVSCAMALAAQSSEEGPLAARRDQLKTALQQEWEYQMRTYPEFATSVGDNRYNDRLTDYSAESFSAQLQHAQQALAVFEAIDPGGFPEQERLSRELMIRGLREQIEGAKFRDWEMPVDQMNGLHLGLASLPSGTNFRTLKDYQDYIARLHQIPRVLDQATADMRLGLHDHLVPPRYLLEKVVVQAQDIANKPVKDSPFSQPVNK